MGTDQATEPLMVRTYTGATLRESNAAAMNDLPAVRRAGHEVHSRTQAGADVTVTYRRRRGSLRSRVVLLVELGLAAVAAIVLTAFVLTVSIELMGWTEDISESAYRSLVVLLSIAVWLALAMAAAAIAEPQPAKGADESGQKARRYDTLRLLALGAAVGLASIVTVAEVVLGDRSWEAPAAAWALVYALWLFWAAARARQGASIDSQEIP